METHVSQRLILVKSPNTLGTGSGWIFIVYDSEFDDKIQKVGLKAKKVARLRRSPKIVAAISTAEREVLLV